MLPQSPHVCCWGKNGSGVSGPLGPFLTHTGNHCIAARQTAQSFDHLIGSAEQRKWKIETECPGCLEVDEQLDLRRLLDWQVSGLLALENPASVDAGLPER